MDYSDRGRGAVRPCGGKGSGTCAQRRRLNRHLLKRRRTMAARANWKGVLKIGEVSCPVALYTAASTAERIAFHILNRKTGHRVHREFVDAKSGKPVAAKEQVKGYETEAGEYIAFEPEEITKAVPEADKTLDVEAFVPCDQVDDVYFDRSYYLAPSAPAGAEAFAPGT